MYAFEPSEEQKMLVDVVNKYATEDLRPAAHDADEAAHFPVELIAKGWEIGTLQASIPGEFGGFGEYSALTAVLAAEELGYGDLAGALAVLVPGLFALPIFLTGSQEQKQTHLPPLLEAEWKPYSAALMESTFDFDPRALRTTASQNGDSYILQGSKSFVPFADQAAGLIVYADLEGQTQGFIVPPATEGLEIGERQKLLGLDALPLFNLALHDVQIPLENRLGGPEGHDFGPILGSFRLANAALAVGLGQAAFEYSRDYAKDREVFGVKVAQKQSIAFMLAEMAMEIESMRLFTWEAAWKLDNAKEDAGKAAYLADLGAAEMAMMVTDRAVQILGGHGYIREHPVELWMRNARGFSIFSGLAMV